MSTFLLYPSSPPTIDVELKHKEMWQQFYSLGNEMLISKEGRRMFPYLGIRLPNLENLQKYQISVLIVPADNNTYLYKEDKWTSKPGPTRGRTNQNPRKHIIYRSLPQYGIYWKNEVCLKSVKLCNDYSKQDGYVVLKSGRKYLIEVHVEQIRNVMPSTSLGALLMTPPYYTTIIRLPVTEFITVTNIRNPIVRELKMRLNPIANWRIGRNSGDLRSTIKIVDVRSLAECPDPTSERNSDDLSNTIKIEDDRSLAECTNPTSDREQGADCNDDPQIVCAQSLADWEPAFDREEQFNASQTEDNPGQTLGNVRVEPCLNLDEIFACSTSESPVFKRIKTEED